MVTRQCGDCIVKYINVESVCFIHETYNIVCQLYFNNNKKYGRVCFSIITSQ